MSTPDHTSAPAAGGAWYIPALVMRLNDGSTLIKPGKPVQRGTVRQVSRATGIHYKVLAALAEAGFIRRARPSPGQSYYYYAEVESFIHKTEADPDFWTKVRRDAYIKGASVKTAKVTV